MNDNERIVIANSTSAAITDGGSSVLFPSADSALFKVLHGTGTELHVLCIATYNQQIVPALMGRLGDYMERYNRRISDPDYQRGVKARLTQQKEGVKPSFPIGESEHYLNGFLDTGRDEEVQKRAAELISN